MLLKAKRRKSPVKAVILIGQLGIKDYRYIRLNTTTHFKPLAVLSGYSAILILMKFLIITPSFCFLIVRQ